MTQSQAFSILKTGANVFLTGEPGSGKTHVINQYAAYLRERGVEPAITASTGIAATHIGGMTIHSWSGIGIKDKLDKYAIDKIVSNEYIEKRVRRAKILVIDEVSMLSSETFSMVDAVCRKIKQSARPFGSMQLVMVGDFFQLPPIEKRKNDETQTALIKEMPPRFAYQSPVWAQINPTVCYLTEQYRQNDYHFLSVLLAIRGNCVSDEHLKYLHSRQVASGNPPERITKLFSHNLDVDNVNVNELDKLRGRAYVFKMVSRGYDALVSALKKGCLSPETLILKKDAVVMFTKNSPKKGFINGTLGAVEGFDYETNYPIIKIRNGRKIMVEPMEWTIEENGKIKARISQIPLRLAWAITVHKSQGMSLDAAVMDLSDVFEFGQGYVALSRVRGLSGLYLLGINRRALEVHPDILAKDATFRAESEKAQAAFSNIPAGEIQKTHNNFICACGGNPASAVCHIHISKKEKPDTLNETLLLWNEQKTVSEIAAARGLKESTIFSHIEELVAKKKIKRSGLFRLLTPSLSRSLPVIHAMFRELKTDKLSPVFEKLSGIYSYDDLRIARLLFDE